LLLSALVGPPALAQRFTVQEAGLDGGGGLVTAGSLTLTSSLGGASPVGTVRTDRYVLFSGMPSPFAGQIAILVVHDPEEGGGTAEGGTDRIVTARIVANEAPLASATLFYRSGGAAEPTAVEMTADERGFVGTIPGSAIGESGLTYYFVATDEQGTSIRAPRSGVFSLPVQVGGSGVERPDVLAGGNTQAAYRLLSMPVVVDDPAPESVLGDDVPTLAGPTVYDPSTARLFEPIGTGVSEYPRVSNFNLGRAFWLIVRDGVDVIDTGAGTTGALNEPVRIDLRQGWNFIGTPFPVSVPVANLETADGSPVTLRSYGADGYNTPDTPVTAMTPFEGYAVFAENTTTLLVNPPLPASERATSSEKGATVKGKTFPWRLRIRGTSPSGWDADNVAAVHAEAADGWDAHDWPEPPALASGLTIAFDAPEGRPADWTLSADVRSIPNRGATWPLTVTTDATGTVRLSVDGVAQVPARFEAWLVDGTTKDTWNLREKQQARVAMLSKESTRPMQLVVGTSAYVSEKLRDLEALPRKYALDAPYPNPSSGPVAFQVGLPQSDRVTVEVYNILGQRIATLKDREQMTAGYHTVVWNAPHLASGLYFVRMEAGSYRETQKLMRVR
jgi:hypothetical protein